MHPKRPMFVTDALASLALGTFLACGGGGHDPAPPPKASRIVYAPPASGAYAFIRNASVSTDTHLVLDLQGPVGTSLRGVAFYLTTDASRLTWAKVGASDAQYAETAFDGAQAYSSIVKTKVTAGELQVAALLQATSPYPSILSPDYPLVTLALDLNPGAPPGDVPLTSPHDKAIMLPSTAGADPQIITLALGTVTLK